MYPCTFPGTYIKQCAFVSDHDTLIYIENLVCKKLENREAVRLYFSKRNVLRDN